jgi:hypothetical protein
VKAKVEVHRYPDGRMAIFHGPRKLADYTAAGKEVKAAGARDQEGRVSARRPPPYANWHTASKSGQFENHYSAVSNFAYTNMLNAQTKQGGGSILLPLGVVGSRMLPLLWDGLPVFPKLLTAE